TGKVVQNLLADNGIRHDLYMVKNRISDIHFSSTFTKNLDKYIQNELDMTVALRNIINSLDD
ncbi:MAG: hypothetical protein PVF17_13675, partial [Ignavibacteria bacterium]